MATILLVEIAKDFTQMFKEALVNEGLTVVSTRGSEEAERVFQTASPDLVLLGLSLPTFAGLDVLARLDLTTRTRKIPAIVITNESWSKGQVAEAHDRGAREHTMARAYDYAPLIQAIKEALMVNQT